MCRRFTGRGGENVAVWTLFGHSGRKKPSTGVSEDAGEGLNPAY
jgi:hypothetical protein